MKIITVKELAELAKTNKKILLLDVRQPEEVAVSAIPESVHIPLMELESRFSEIKALDEKGYDIKVVYCRSGKRSEKARLFLEEQGLTTWLNLEGGIIQYAKDIDPQLPVH